jgi:hypothetical protein
MSTDIETLSTILFNQFKKTKETIKFCNCQSILNLNIQSIDGVKCDACFKFYSDQIQFIIVSSNIVDNSYNSEFVELYRDCVAINLSMSNTHIKEWTDNFAFDILETLPKLKLNIHGKLSPSETADDIDIQLNDIFARITNVTINPTDECCVCCNHTYTKTPCKHSLCYRCWFKLGKTDDENPDDGLDFTCPICRGNINCVQADE